MSFTLFLVILGLFGLLAFFRASLLSWLIGLGIVVPLIAIDSRITGETLQWIYVGLGVFIVVFAIPWLRRQLVTRHILKLFRNILPPLSQTEREALEAGTVWWDGELFGGYPHWQRLLDLPKPALSATERSFLENEVEQLCTMLDDWEITHVRRDLPPEIWQFIKAHGFFGMIIPKEYGGLGFSAQAHSAVITKIASRSGSAAVTVMVPNSLGPAELLLRYGTAEQKAHYLPRLARGEDIPCFALTGPEAGSDAAAIPDHGIVCHGTFNGATVLGVRLNWEKRYITLAPVATLLGLAFRLYDPEHLLGPTENRGITLALVPTHLPGIEIGRRHLPLDSAFLNGPTTGHDVFIPLDHLIGGEQGIGQGWHMLMECLAAGRAISLPASVCGGVKLAARSSGAYSRVRRQFHLPIGKFEGVKEALARIAGNLYVMDAARTLTAQAIDHGERPAVISAIVKYHCTERGRAAINDAMDIHGGKGICLGPNNYLARHYQQTPIGITVEGANILTRSLIIFGQGAVRAHPLLLKEMHAAHHPDRRQGLREFDEAFFAHLGFTVSNAVRSLLFALSDGRIVDVPTEAPTRRYYQALTRYATAFAFASDIAMLVLGGNLKRHENLSARLGDVLSQLYLASAVLKRYEDDGRPEEDQPLLHWTLQDVLWRIEHAFDGVLQNLPNRPAAWLMRALIFPLGRWRRPPADTLSHAVAQLLLQPGAARDRLTAGMYLPRAENDALAALEAALASTLACEPLQDKLAAAIKEGRLHGHDELARIADAEHQGVLDEHEVVQLQHDYSLRRRVIMVDAFIFGKAEACHTEHEGREH